MFYQGPKWASYTTLWYTIQRFKSRNDVDFHYVYTKHKQLNMSVIHVINSKSRITE